MNNIAIIGIGEKVERSLIERIVDVIYSKEKLKYKTCKETKVFYQFIKGKKESYMIHTTTKTTTAVN